MTKAKAGLTRRGFIGTAALALGAGAVSATGVLSGCSAQPSERTDKASAEKPANVSMREINVQDESFTTSTTDYAALYEPLAIGSTTMANRFVKSSAGSDTLDPAAGVLNDNFLEYYENFAKGGASVVWLEGYSALHAIDPVTHTTKGMLAGANAVEILKPMAERIHAQGALVGYQWSSMFLKSADVSLEDIHYVQEQITALAMVFKEAGFDAFELNAASAHFLNSFLSRNYNTREDEYGPQSIENRTRFITETIQMIKKACGADFIVQLLINGVEENDTKLGDNAQYLTIEESIENAQALEKAGADSFYVRAAVPGMHIAQFAPDVQHVGYKTNGITGYGTQIDFEQHYEGMVNGQYSGCASWLALGTEIKKNVSVPVGVSGYMDPRTAPDLITNAIADKKIDFILMNRPLTVDPELPNKLKEGRRDEVAPCCRCMHCHNKEGVELCRVNAVTQRAYSEEMPEGYKLLPAQTSKKVMVVGGGPAGMEAARIAALRGHDVTLYEKQTSLGGLVKTAHVFKGDHERLGDLVDYLAKQQEVTGVTVVTGTEVDAETISQEKPDAVIVAVGGTRENSLSASGSTTVVGIDNLIGSDIGDKVVICGAGAQAIDCALYLLAEGKSVQMVHGGTKAAIDKEQSFWVRSFVVPHLYAQGVKIWSGSSNLEVIDGGLSMVADGGFDKTLACDTVIECYDMVPNEDLAVSLSEDYDLYTVGDCAAPDNIASAIAAGNLAARKI